MSNKNSTHRLTGSSARIALILIVIAAFAASLVYAQESHQSNNDQQMIQANNTPVTAGQDRPLNTLRDLNQAYVDIANEVRPAVVTVSTERVMKVNNFPFGDSPFFDFFFGQPNGHPQHPQEQFHQRGLGSGVIIKPDGLILTNNHVIDGADSIYVRTYSGKRYMAKVVGADPHTDIAVIRIKADNLKSLPVGNSDDLHVGEIVLAVGSPMSENLAYTVTQGIVSATGRSNVGLEDYEDFIQTDAAINPGNSGGPLVNLDGKLVGINTAIASQSGGFQGIGFAVPSNMAMDVMNSLLANGKVIRGWLGITIQNVNDQLAGAMDLKTSEGALVGDVLKDTPAADANLKPGDVITSLDNQPIKDSSQLRNRVASMKPGTKVDLGIVRDGEKKSVEVTLGEMPSKIAEVPSNSNPDQLLGFQTSNLTPQLASQADVPLNSPGVVVTSINNGSNAYQAGLREGDLIRSLNRKPVKDESDFVADADHLKSGSDVLLRVQRHDGAFYLAFQV